VGTRPHFIKVAPLVHALKQYEEISYALVHTGQHYDSSLSEQFFEEFNLPWPSFHLDVKENGQSRQIAQILLGLDDLFIAQRPAAVLVFGDTSSSAAGAMAASMQNIPLVHIEAGMREFDKTIPEEKNKLIITALADFHFAPTPTAIENLNGMGIHDHTYLVGDIVQDLLLENEEDLISDLLISEWGLQPAKYYLLTCHRALNTNISENLESILKAMNQLDLPVVFPMHPRTKKAIHDFGLHHYLGKNIIQITPQSFWTTQSLVQNAKVVITDSGGIIREAYFHKVPGVIIDRQTEWIETVNEGWNVVTGPEEKAIVKAVKNAKKPDYHSMALGNGNTSIKILEILKQKLGL
jgi:UDP-N-acetylglucosamine 2-epimerase